MVSRRQRKGNVRRQTRRQSGGTFENPFKRFFGQSAKNRMIAERNAELVKLRAQVAAAKGLPVTTVTNLSGVSPIARVEANPPTGPDLMVGTADPPKQGFMSRFKMPTFFQENKRSNADKLKSMIEDRQARNRLTFATKDKNYRIVGNDGNIEGEAAWKDTGNPVIILKDNRRGQYRNSTIYDYPETGEKIYTEFTNNEGVVDVQKFTNTKKEKPVRVRVYYPSTNTLDIERMERVVKNQITREKLKKYKTGYEEKLAKDKIKWNAIDTAIQNAKTTTLKNLNTLYTEYSRDISTQIENAKKLDTNRIENKVKTVQDAQFTIFQKNHIYKPTLKAPEKGDPKLDEPPFTGVQDAISKVSQNRNLEPKNTVYDDSTLNTKLGEIMGAAAPPATSMINTFTGILGIKAKPAAPAPAVVSTAASPAPAPALVSTAGSAVDLSGAAAPAGGLAAPAGGLAAPAPGAGAGALPGGSNSRAANASVAGSGASGSNSRAASGSVAGSGASGSNSRAASGTSTPEPNEAEKKAAAANAAGAAAPANAAAPAAPANGSTSGGRRTRRRKNRSRR